MGAAGAFVTGLLQGGLAGYKYNKEQEEREADRKIRLDAARREEESHQLRMDEANEKKQDRIALQNAAAPVTVQTDDTVLKDDQGYEIPGGGRFRVAGGNTAQRFDNQADAEALAAKVNDPAARAQRIGLAYMERGKPVEAMEFQEKAQGYADKQWDRDLRDALTRGHDGIAEFMTKTQAGVLKGKSFKAVPSADGKSVTYGMVGEDGTVTPTKYTLPADENGAIQAAYQLAKISPETRYQHMVAADKAKYEREFKDQQLALRERQLNEVSIPLAEARATAAGAQATAALARAEAAGRKGADAPNREERLRWTTMFSDAGRRLSEANKSLAALSKDAGFMALASDPKSPQAQQLQGLRADVEQYKQDREMYGGLLAGSQGAEAREGKGGTKPVAPQGKGGSTAPAEKQADKPGATRANPVAVADRAARDKLPKGTYYRAPNGEVYIKQ